MTPDEVRRVIDTHFGGSVNAAAHAWQIPQPTLRRFLIGQTKSSHFVKSFNCRDAMLEWLRKELSEADARRSRIVESIASFEAIQ